MVFSFGKYTDYEVDFVIEIDRKYCEWIIREREDWIRKKHPDLHKELTVKLKLIPEPEENPEILMFGRYEGENIEDFILSDKSYCLWLLEKSSLQEEYPKTYDYLKKYYSLIYEEQSSKIVYFYFLTFCDKDYLKVGITTNFIVKRIYSYTHTMNFYDKHVIDYKKSFVYMTNDADIENKVKKAFTKQRVDRKTERFKIAVKEIDEYIENEQLSNLDFYYSKKCLNDFIPFDYGSEFKESFYIKINEFVNFREVYENHLNRLDLIEKYNPEFMEIRQNKN